MQDPKKQSRRGGHGDRRANQQQNTGESASEQGGSQRDTNPAKPRGESGEGARAPERGAGAGQQYGGDRSQGGSSE